MKVYQINTFKVNFLALFCLVVDVYCCFFQCDDMWMVLGWGWGWKRSEVIFYMLGCGGKYCISYCYDIGDGEKWWWSSSYFILT